MKTIVFTLSLRLMAGFQAYAEPCPELLNFKMNKLRSSEQVDFCQAFTGKVVLAVNTASNCGFTPQFKGLEALYQKYKDQGLVVVGFPSNDFFQEFDNPEKTANVCYLNYGVTFPVMTKSSVRGSDANAFFKGLIAATGESPKWNFYKYLISRDGLKVSAFGSITSPEELESTVKAVLEAQ